MKSFKYIPGTLVQVFASVINSDGNEGRGHDVHIAYFWTEREAVNFARGKDVMGSDGKAKPCMCVVGANKQLYRIQDAINVSENVEEQKRTEAINKLKSSMTAAELKLLGIDV